MSGDNNFLVFNPSKTLILSDADYNLSENRLNGVSAGQASAALHNKLFFQMSTFVAAFSKALNDSGFNAVDYDFNGLVNSINQFSNVEKSWPVGSIYYNEDDDRNPHDIFGFGTWVSYAPGRTLVGADGVTYVAGSTGGAAKVALVSDNNGPHTHVINPIGVNSGDGAGYVVSGSGAPEAILSSNTGSSGLGTPHENMQPYIVANIWKRTA